MIIDEVALTRSIEAAIAVLAALLSLAALLYAGHLKKIEEDRREKILIFVEMARVLRLLVVLQLVSLVYRSTAYLLRLFYAPERAPLEPWFVFWMDLGQSLLGIFIAAFPAVLLVSIIIRIKREKRQRVVPRVLRRLFDREDNVRGNG